MHIQGPQAWQNLAFRAQWTNNGPHKGRTCWGVSGPDTPDLWLLHLSASAPLPNSPQSGFRKSPWLFPLPFLTTISRKNINDLQLQILLWGRNHPQRRWYFQVSPEASSSRGWTRGGRSLVGASHPCGTHFHADGSDTTIPAKRTGYVRALQGNSKLYTWGG